MSEKTSWRMFGWVPDGIYDNENYLTRYQVVDGMPTNVITKMWLDKGGPEDCPSELLQPWKYYPDFPPKPEKKT